MELDTRKLECFVMEKMAKTRLPGLSLAILDENGVLYARGLGYRDVEHGLEATPHTSYCIGSVTKSFTALAIMQLAEEGKLSLEDPVEKHVPLGVRPFGEPIRIWHFLTHSSGLPALAYAEALIRDVIGDSKSWLPIASPEDVLAFMARAGDWAEAKPGKEFFYLNEGYVLLGLVVSRVSGLPYEQYVREHILEPLGMKRSYFTREEFEADQDKAIPYIIDKEGNRVRSTYPFGISADGGLISNVLDLARYLRIYLRRGELEGARLLSEEGIEAMEEPRVKLPDGRYYGYGWIITQEPFGEKLVCHGGSVLVSTAWVGYLPRRGLGVAVLANGKGYPLVNIGLYALSLALGRDPEKLEVIRRDRLLDRLAGPYETYMGTYRVEVVRKGDFLFLEARGRYTEASIPLVPEELGEEVATFFTYENGRRRVAEFRLKPDGRVELIYERYKFRKVS